jgi:hypothetical protein
MTDIIGINHQFIADPLYSADFDVLMDFRNCEALIFRIEILEYINFFKNTIKLKKKVKSAIIINSMNAEFLFKTYKSFISLFNIETEKFHDLESCLHWLKPKQNEYAQVKENLLNMIPSKLNGQGYF